MATATATAKATTSPQRRQRLRELLPDLKLGNYPTGPLNGITDVPGVLTHTTTLRSGDGAVNTGVTTILPRRDWFHQACYAGFFRFNGSGEMTGTHWIEETGLLHSPVVLTSSFSVGECYRGIYDHAVARHADRDGGGGVGWFLLPVVAETFDGYLNDMTRFAVTPAHVVDSIERAGPGLTPEGCTGGGTGMICQGFKGGTGTASRVVPGVGGGGGDGDGVRYTVGALVQANYGRLRDLRVAGAPVGRIIAERRAARQQGDGGDPSAGERQRQQQQQQEDLERAKDRKDGSIVVVLATDAPLHPAQLTRVAKRATVGLARAGGYGHNPSGDLFLAFSTANRVPVQTVTADQRDVDPFRVRPLDGVAVADDASLNALFEAAADAVEEAIYNALCMAETVVGFRGRVVEAVDLGELRDVIVKFMACG